MRRELRGSSNILLHIHSPITRIPVSRAIAISIISSATALIGILAQVSIVYTYLGIVLEATSIFISIPTTVIFTFGICLLVSTASLLVPLKYMQIVPLIFVAIFYLGFTTLSDIGSITIDQMYMYSVIYIALGMGMAITSLIAIKRCIDMISINIVSSA